MYKQGTTRIVLVITVTAHGLLIHKSPIVLCASWHLWGFSIIGKICNIICLLCLMSIMGSNAIPTSLIKTGTA